MKTSNKKKIIVSTLALAMGAALAGSISGSVAWYQYSTRATAEFTGTAAHCTEALEIRVRSSDEATFGWRSDLPASVIASYLTTEIASGGAERNNATDLHPVTSGELAEGEVASTFYRNPIYQYGAQSTWGAATATEDYVVIPLELRVKDVDGGANVTMLEKDIYVSAVALEAETTNPARADVSNALRLGVSAGTDANALTQYATFSKTGDDVEVAGALDLNNDSQMDKTNTFSWQSGKQILYGTSESFVEVANEEARNALEAAADDIAYVTGDKFYQYNGSSWEEYEIPVAESTAITPVTSDVLGVADDSDPYDITGTAIGTATASNTLKVDLVIYLEGWQQLGGSALWNSSNTTDSTIGAQFNVGIRFSAEAHENH